MSAPTDLLTPDLIRAINRPVADATGLPRGAYTDPAFLALERDHVFDASWVFVAAAESLPAPGDVLPLDLIDRPIVLVRQRDGGVRAFHNVCRHRGVILVAEAASGRPVLTCPYHAWAYGLDGTLLKTPHFGGEGNHDHGGIDRACLDLRPVRCEVWNGLVFVNLSGTACTLAEHMAPVARRYADFDFSAMRLGGTMDFSLAANWKLPIENFIEGYHLPWTHPFLNAISSMANHYSVLDELIVGQGSILYERDKAGHDGLPVFEGLSEHWRVRAEYPSLLPNMLLGVHVDHITVWAMFPQGPDRVLERVFFFYAGEAALTPELAPQRARVEENLRSINLEDVGVVESMQRGRASPGYVDARFSPFQERTVHAFERQIANAVAEGVGLV
jgi:choline monooxygenase